MKRWLIVLLAMSFVFYVLLLEVALVPLLAQQGLIQIKYDKFKNETTILTNPEIFNLVRPEDHPILNVIIVCKGEKINKKSVKEIGIGFFYPIINRKYSGELYGLADGKGLDLHNATLFLFSQIISYKDIILTGYSVNINYATLEKMWNAKKLESKKGQVEFTLSEIEKAMLQELKALFEK